MTEYKEEEILRLIIRLLNELTSHIGFPPYNYKVYLSMEPEEGLKLLSFRLRRLRDIKKGTKKDFHFYFSTELGYTNFLIESDLVEYLNVFLIMKKEKSPIPPLCDNSEEYGTDKEFSTRTMRKMTPFVKWLRACKDQKDQQIRAVTR